MESADAPTDERTPWAERVSVLLEEYRALYGLAELRLNALDRRVPAIGATILAALGGIPALPGESALLVFCALPVTLVWYLRTTINHARSFEDALRGIERLECDVNNLFGEELLRFQSQHPSRGRSVGGRTGGETVSAVLLACLLMLGFAGYLSHQASGDVATPLLVYNAVIALYLLQLVRRWAAYRTPVSTGAIGSGIASKSSAED